MIVGKDISSAPALRAAEFQLSCHFGFLNSRTNYLQRVVKQLRSQLYRRPNPFQLSRYPSPFARCSTTGGESLKVIPDGKLLVSRFLSAIVKWSASMPIARPLE